MTFVQISYCFVTASIHYYTDFVHVVSLSIKQTNYTLMEIIHIYISPSNEGRHIVLVWFFLLLLLSEVCLDHNFFVFPDRSIIFGMWVHDHKAVCHIL